jgi:hypothetical protein
MSHHGVLRHTPLRAYHGGHRYRFLAVDVTQNQFGPERQGNGRKLRTRAIRYEIPDHGASLTHDGICDPRQRCRHTGCFCPDDGRPKRLLLPDQSPHPQVRRQNLDLVEACDAIDIYQQRGPLNPPRELRHQALATRKQPGSFRLRSQQTNSFCRAGRSRVAEMRRLHSHPSE